MNTLVFSILYCAANSVVSVGLPDYRDSFAWVYAALAVILVLVTWLVISRRSNRAAIIIAPLFVAIFAFVEIPFFESLREGVIEWSAFHIAVLVGVVVYGGCLLACATLVLRHTVRRSLLGNTASRES